MKVLTNLIVAALLMTACSNEVKNPIEPPPNTSGSISTVPAPLSFVNPLPNGYLKEGFGENAILPGVITLGSAPYSQLFVTEDGKITDIGESFVEITHDSGYVSFYSGTINPLVKLGEMVHRGYGPIAQTKRNTFRLAIYNKDGVAVDPMKWMKVRK